MTSECPYGSARWVSQAEAGTLRMALYSESVQKCGEDGWLCDWCKEDRADARTERIVEELRRQQEEQG